LSLSVLRNSILTCLCIEIGVSNVFALCCGLQTNVKVLFSRSYIYYYRINKLCIKLVIETSLHYDARSEKHQIIYSSGKFKILILYYDIL
jgi:hypothetical protein